MPESSDSSRPASPAKRTISRIVFEAVVVGLLGATALGIAWELDQARAGLIAAVVIWIAGAPFLEIMRVVQGDR